MSHAGSTLNHVVTLQGRIHARYRGLRNGETMGCRCLLLRMRFPRCELLARQTDISEGFRRGAVSHKPAAAAGQPLEQVSQTGQCCWIVMGASHLQHAGSIGRPGCRMLFVCFASGVPEARQSASASNGCKRCVRWQVAKNPGERLCRDPSRPHQLIVTIGCPFRCGRGSVFN